MVGKARDFRLGALEPHFVEFAAKFGLAPVKRRYQREHSLDVPIVLLPFLKVLRTTRALLVFGRRIATCAGSTAEPPRRRAPRG